MVFPFFVRMRILYVAPEISIPGTHGGSSHVSEMVESFVRLGHDVVLLCKHDHDQRFYDKDLFTYIRVPIFGSGFLRHLLYCFFTFFTASFFLLFRRIDVVIERGRIFGGVSIILARLFRVRSVYELIEPYTEVPLYTGQLRRDSFLYHSIRRWHDFVVRCSTMTLVTHPSFLEIVPRQKAYFSDSGVNPIKFTPDIASSAVRRRYGLISGKTVLYAGSFQEWHACENILLAAQQVLKKDKSVRFLMIGDGKRLSLCKSLAHNLHIDHAVLFPGAIDFSLLPSYLSASDICLALFDRTYPPFRTFDYFYSPIKIHEYKACGKSIVASNFGNLKRLVKDGVNGLLVDERRIEDIAATILRLVRSSSLRRAIAKKNRSEAVLIYNWDVLNRKLLLELFRRKL